MKLPTTYPLHRAGLAGAFAALALFATTSAQAAGPKVYRFTAGGANIFNNEMVISAKDLDAKPTLKLIVTQYYTGVYNDHPIGVRYDVATKKWRIANEDGAAMAANVSFNVLIPTTSLRVYSGSSNTYFDRTFFPLQKKNANALLLETHVMNPFPAITDNQSIANQKLLKNVGFYFIPVSAVKPTPADSATWSIYDEDLSPGVVAAYNVADATKDGGKTPFAFKFSTTAANILTIDANTTITNANAVLFVNHVYGPVNSNTHDHRVGVSYFNGVWHIFNEDQATQMPAGLDFVVDVFPGVNP